MTKSEDASAELTRLFTQMRDTPSAVNKHMDLITEYARKSDSIVEFGMGRCDAMLAIMNGLPEVYRGYDLSITPGQINVAAVSAALGINIHLAEESKACLSQIEHDADMVVISDNYWRANEDTLDDLSRVYRYIIVTHTGIIEEEGDYSIPDFTIVKYVRPTERNHRDGLVVYQRNEES